MSVRSRAAWGVRITWACVGFLALLLTDKASRFVLNRLHVQRRRFAAFGLLHADGDLLTQLLQPDGVQVRLLLEQP